MQSPMMAARCHTRMICSRTLIQAGRALAAPSATRPGDAVRVLGGPLRGACLEMPQAERPSFVSGTYERAIVAALRHYIVAGATVYDVGAHVGYLSLVMAGLVGATGRVMAFEANPRNQQSLIANVSRYAPNRVTVKSCAVSDVTRIVSFATFDYSTVGHIGTDDTPNNALYVDVQATSLDDVVYKRGLPAPALIKIDVEGAEAAVLRGADDLLRDHRPVIIAEARATDEWHDAMERLSTYGYTSTPLNRWTDTMADALLLPS